MLLEYSTSNIILRVEMLTISSGATDLFFASLCICYLLLFLLPRSGLYPTEEQIAVKHELKKNKHTDWDSNISVTLYKCRSQAEMYAASKIFAAVFSFS